MLDVEDQVVDRVSKALRARFKGIFIVSTDTQTAHCRENHTELMYQGNIYSNLTSGGKRQCREIAAVIDETMTEMGFIRVFGQPVLNPADTSKSRYALRYKGIVGTDGIVYTS